MNSFQAQFNSLLGIALGAQKLSQKTLGTPSDPTPTKMSQTEKVVEGSSNGEYNPVDMGFNQYFQTGAISEEGRMALLAKERSLQNLRDRHSALRTIKAARKGELTFRGND